MPQIDPFIAVLLTAAGLIFLFAALVGPSLVNLMAQQRSGWTPANGTVENLRRDPDRGLLATISFKDRHGTPRRAIVTASNSWYFGQGLEVFYNPENPSQAVCSTFKPLTRSQAWLARLGLCAVGCFLFYVASHARR
jgi:hypothetical protein